MYVPKWKSHPFRTRFVIQASLISVLITINKIARAGRDPQTYPPLFNERTYI